jgi:hypothetical protein
VPSCQLADRSELESAHSVSSEIVSWETILMAFESVPGGFAPAPAL